MTEIQYFTCIGNSMKSPVVPCTREQWEAARKRSSLKNLCYRIFRCKDADKARRLKDKLPVWTPRCAAFKNHHRAEKDALNPLPTRLMLDIDVKGKTQQIMDLLQREGKEAFIGPYPILLIEESVRKGTHVMVEIPQGMSPNEVQAQFSELVHLPVDPAVKNVAGCIYMVPEENTKFVSERIFTNNEAKDAVAQPNVENPTGESQSESPFLPSLHFLSPPTPIPSAYDGIDYAAIVACLADQLGGIPEHGARNSFIFAMACNLRYICNHDAQWVAHILPTYGEAAEKAFATIRSACNRPQTQSMPAIMKRAIENARMKQNAELVDDSSLILGNTPPKMPEQLPKVIELLTSNVPTIYKPAVATAVFPSLATHLHGVDFTYIDGVRHEATLMCVLMAPQSIGKGCVNMPIEYILKDIKAKDQESRQKEACFKEQYRKRGANKEKPQRPDDICIQVLMSNMTNASLVQRAIDAEKNGGKFLYTKIDEIELLDQIKASGGAKASELIRLAFDCAEYGQERVGNESITGTPPLRWNWNASTTIEAGQRFFRNALTNGTLSRINLCTIIKPEDRSIPRFKEYGKDFEESLKPFILLLNTATGRIDCEEAKALAEQLLEENAEMVALSDDEVLETLSFRANVIAYLKAMILYICNGYVWDKDIENFVKWSEQYDLWCKMQFFGEDTHKVLNETRRKRKRGPRNMLGILPEEFTNEELIAIRKAQGMNEDTKSQLRTWLKRAYIEKTSRGFIKVKK